VPIIATFGAGFTTGYSAIFLPQLQSNSSSIQVTEEESSWVASLAAFAMAPGCILGGFIMQKYGRKFAHYFLCLPAIIGWLSIYLADSLTPILLGRFLTGIKNYIEFLAKFYAIFLQVYPSVSWDQLELFISVRRGKHKMNWI
jgi:MFS family permease